MIQRFPLGVTFSGSLSITPAATPLNQLFSLYCWNRAWFAHEWKMLFNLWYRKPPSVKLKAGEMGFARTVLQPGARWDVNTLKFLGHDPHGVIPPTQKQIHSLFPPAECSDPHPGPEPVCRGNKATQWTQQRTLTACYVHVSNTHTHITHYSC